MKPHVQAGLSVFLSLALSIVATQALRRLTLMRTDVDGEVKKSHLPSVVVVIVPLVVGNTWMEGQNPKDQKPKDPV